LAKGVTHIYFQANVRIFTGIVFVAGILMGMGMAAVYRHIPDYFPNDVGVVGGMVGVLGGLGGFVGPVIFGYLLSGSGIWTTNWMVLALVSAVCLVWMHMVIRRQEQQQSTARSVADRLTVR
jgi:NNP family nitrate/nitrite transporter-like MFS transporter